jgi:hypothetical protein
MLLFYIDESGTGLEDKRSPFFVLSAFAVFATECRLLDEKVTQLKRQIFPWAKPEDFEIKGRDIRRGEKFYKNLDWPARAELIGDIAQLIDDFTCRIFLVRVDKRDLPEYIASNNDLYRLAFWRLLDSLELQLSQIDMAGLLMMDMRSDLHSSVQDRRLLDSYREWEACRKTPSHFVELPWFGFSAFYAGLQLCDFVAYAFDFAHNERQH